MNYLIDLVEILTYLVDLIWSHKYKGLLRLADTLLSANTKQNLIFLTIFKKIKLSTSNSTHKLYRKNINIHHPNKFIDGQDLLPSEKQKNHFLKKKKKKNLQSLLLVESMGKVVIIPRLIGNPDQQSSNQYPATCTKSVKFGPMGQSSLLDCLIKKRETEKGDPTPCDHIAYAAAPPPLPSPLLNLLPTPPTAFLP